LTGVAEHGGIQIIAYPMKIEAYQQLQVSRSDEVKFSRCVADKESKANSMNMDLRRRIDASGNLRRFSWHSCLDTSIFSRCYVHITNSRIYHELTGNLHQLIRLSPGLYRGRFALFDYYDEQALALSAARTGKPDSVAALGIKRTKPLCQKMNHGDPKPIKNLGIVREGKFW